jgi:hypothetical protein
LSVLRIIHLVGFARNSSDVIQRKSRGRGDRLYVRVAAIGEDSYTNTERS